MSARSLSVLLYILEGDKIQWVLQRIRNEERDENNFLTQGRHSSILSSLERNKLLGMHAQKLFTMEPLKDCYHAIL
jgi:hypothetical protein